MDSPSGHRASLENYLTILHSFFDFDPFLFEEVSLVVLVPFEESEEP